MLAILAVDDAWRLKRNGRRGAGAFQTRDRQRDQRASPPLPLHTVSAHCACRSAIAPGEEPAPKASA
jgi:hypothetical protein